MPKVFTVYIAQQNKGVEICTLTYTAGHIEFSRRRPHQQSSLFLSNHLKPLRPEILWITNVSDIFSSFLSSGERVIVFIHL